MTEKEELVAYFKYYLGIYLEILRKTTKSSSHDCRCSDREANRTPSEYKSKELQPVPNSSAVSCKTALNSPQDAVSHIWCHGSEVTAAVI